MKKSSRGSFPEVSRDTIRSAVKFIMDIVHSRRNIFRNIKVVSALLGVQKTVGGEISTIIIFEYFVEGSIEKISFIFVRVSYRAFFNQSINQPIFWTRLSLGGRGGSSSSWSLQASRSSATKDRCCAGMPRLDQLRSST